MPFVINISRLAPLHVRPPRVARKLLKYIFPGRDRNPMDCDNVKSMRSLQNTVRIETVRGAIN